MEEVLKKVLVEEAESMFNVLYENVEQEGKVVTKEFQEGLKVYEKSKEKNKEILLKKIFDGYKSNEKAKKEVEELLNNYKESIYIENGYYIKHYYIQGIKDGMILLANAFKKE